MSEIRRTGSEDEAGFAYNDGPPEVAGVECQVCGHFIKDDSAEDAHAHAGRWLCTSCFYQQPAVVAALESIGGRGDYE